MIKPALLVATLALVAFTYPAGASTLNAFNKVQNYTLPNALVTDTATIAAGTVVDVQYVFFDPSRKRCRTRFRYPPQDSPA